MPPENSDLSQSDRVPRVESDRSAIHIPGYIQPHGVLLVLEEPELTLVQVSRNTTEFLGLPPEDLLGRTLRDLLDSEQIDAIASCLQRRFENVNPLKLTFKPSQRSFDAIAHRHANLLLLELEASPSLQNANFFDFYRWANSPVSQMQKASTSGELSQIIAREVRTITGFDRVMVYRFLEDGVGRVIAEDKREDIESYLNLHYPAFDIPPAARRLFALNLLRLIPDIRARPVALVPELNPITNEPLDMSLSALRGVSPCHLEYLHNMGVTASMSISLLDDNQLWGLIACHHHSPKTVPYEIRTVCEFLARVMSLELAAKEDSEDRDYKIKLNSLQSQFVALLSQSRPSSELPPSRSDRGIQSQDWVESLRENSSKLLELVGASGAVLHSGNEIACIGQTPAESQIRNLLHWLETQMQDEVIYRTDSLGEVYPAAEEFKAVASGLLALSISRAQKLYVLWFRPEVIQTVNWGGNPNQAIEVTQNGELRLSPRKSFALWQEMVRGTSLSWKSYETEAALALHGAIVGIVLRKAEELARVNRELERSNQELDAFAYIASHDLKEPLRGIHNYSSFLLEDYGNVLDEDGLAKLQTLMRLTQRMEDLIESLLHFSRLGRVELVLEPLDLDDLVKNSVLDLLKARITESGAEIRIPRPLPTVRCDRVQGSELFANLIGNAIKYNDKPHKWVEIGYLDPDEEDESPYYTFYVKDNGIGIRERHFDSVFRIFKRLHARDRYGGGTGVGLTIAKKIVERHGGTIWLESTYGKGTTFYFTLIGVQSVISDR